MLFITEAVSHCYKCMHIYHLMYGPFHGYGYNVYYKSWMLCFGVHRGSCVEEAFNFKAFVIVEDSNRSSEPFLSLISKLVLIGLFYFHRAHSLPVIGKERRPAANITGHT